MDGHSVCTVNGYEPVPTLDPMAPENLLKFVSYNWAQCKCLSDFQSDIKVYWCPKNCLHGHEPRR